MERLITSAGFAAAMILTALGVANGTVDAEAGKAMMVILPAVAVATLRPAKCAKSLKALCS